MSESVDVLAAIGWRLWIPGLGPWLVGRRRAAVGFAAVFLAYLAVIVSGPVRFALGFLYPLRALHTKVAIEQGAAGFRPGTGEEFVASITLVIALSVCVGLSARYARNALTDQGRRYGLPQWQLAWREFLKHELAVVGLALVVALYSIAFLCPYLVPYDPTAGLDVVEGALIPPLGSLTVLHLEDGSRRYTRVVERDGDEVRIRQGATVQFHRGKLESRPKMETIAVAALRGGGVDTALERARYVLGTDTLGRDVLSRLIYGSRVSLAIGLIAVLIAVTLGTVVGSVAGFFGGAVDGALMRLVDVIIAFPRLFLILLIVALFTPSIFIVVGVLGATSWMGVSRLVRGQFLTLKEMEFATAARAIGQTSSKIMFRHLLPNALAPVIVDATLRIGNTILVEATLSFLGLGDSTVPTWGQMVFNGKQAMLNGWWIATFSGLAIVTTVVAFNLVGDGLRDALDPRLRN